MAQEHLSGSPRLLKLWVAMPNENRRAKNIYELLDLVDDEGNFNFSELLNRYRIGFENLISVTHSIVS